MKKALIYLRPIIEGDDDKPSLRRVLTVILAIGFVHKANQMPGTIELLNAISTPMLLLAGLTTFQVVSKNFTNTNNNNANTDGSQP